jgi:hypothetical protein
MRHLFVTAVTALTLFSLEVQPAIGQNNAARPETAQPGTAQPVPRWPDGKVYFGPLAGAKGLWGYPLSNRLEGGDLTPNNPPIPGEVLHRRDPDDIPFQPWAKALFEFRVITRLEPYTRCKPSGGPRQISSAYGTQLLDFPDLKRFFILQTGGAHSYRTVFMDGRPHPQNYSPTYYGHSIGHWEADTLVVDTVGFNEKMWIASLGTPTTDKLHLIEKFTRVSLEWTRYEVMIDDPGAYTAPWSSGFYLKLDPNAESFEYVCQENNGAHVLTGDSTLLNYFEDPSSRFIP